jgi:hypothetical protein
MNTHAPKRKPGETLAEYRARLKSSREIAKKAIKGSGGEPGLRINPARAAKRKPK